MQFFAFSVGPLLLISPWTAQPTTLAINKVVSWEDLLKQPVSDIGGDVKIRLGIDALECPRWSGVGLYAFTEGFDDEISRIVSRNDLGPVLVSVRFGDISLDSTTSYSYAPRWAWQQGDKQPRLFFRILMIDKVGDYQLTVHSVKGKVIAQVSLKGTDSAFHPWSPLLLTKEAEYERIREAYQFRRIAPAQAQYQGQGIALPDIDAWFGYTADGWSPWKRVDQQFRESMNAPPFGKGALPKLLPQESDPGLHLKIIQKNTFVLQIISKDRIERFRPDWHFLCRWWVNGTPFIPKQVAPIPLLEGGAVLVPDREDDLQIELALRPKDLKAKSGDLVELQLLHCPRSWLAVKYPLPRGGGGTGLPRLTNKISFKFP